MSKKTGLSQRQFMTLLKLCGAKFHYDPTDRIEGQFYASTSEYPRNVTTTVPPVKYKLDKRVACAYYHPYSELKDPTTNKVIHTNNGPFYWGKVYTIASRKLKNKKKWRPFQYQYHFVTGSTWLEFVHNFAIAIGKEYI